MDSDVSDDCRPRRPRRNDSVGGGVVVAGAAIGGVLLVWGVVYLLLPALRLPASAWLLIGLLPVYYIWRKVGGRPALEARQIGLVIVAVIALEAAFDAVLWGAKVALVISALVLIFAAGRRSSKQRGD